ncbi:hypothetical protein Vretifemale_12444, partial [Volvox reticuliferus]
MWRLSVPLLLLLLAATGGRSQEVFQDDDEDLLLARTQVDVVGELQYISVHITKEKFWVIRDSDGKMTQIASGFQPPPKDDYGNDIVPGAVVSVPCYIDPSGVCNPIPELKMTVISDTSSTIMANTEPIYQRLLVIILDMAACGNPASIKPVDAATIWLGPNGDGLGGMAQKFTQCSYGMLNLNATAFRAITVQASCIPEVVDRCSFLSIINIADTGAKAQYGYDVFSTFTHIAYVLPPKMQSVCPWSGLALLPGNRIWLQTAAYGVYRWSTIMQESL